MTGADKSWNIFPTALFCTNIGTMLMFKIYCLLFTYLRSILDTLLKVTYCLIRRFWLIQGQYSAKFAGLDLVIGKIRVQSILQIDQLLTRQKKLEYFKLAHSSSRLWYERTWYKYFFSKFDKLANVLQIKRT